MKENERKVKRYSIEFEDGYNISFTPKDVEDMEYALKMKRLLKDLYWATV